mmetsp:Transcript_66946/g.125087  ORF Transcript_66946/g.125087 Transcript_66946/m.125087 type:complete len:157 (+) Transcript_66946:239-709(+)
MKLMPRKGCAEMWNNTLAPQTGDHRMADGQVPDEEKGTRHVDSSGRDGGQGAMRHQKCGVVELLNDGREVPGNIKPELPWKCVHVFLNAVPGGGQLRFPRLSLEVLPHPGCAVLMAMPGDAADLQTRKMLEHRGRPPTEGYRYVALCCFQSAKPKA